METSRRMTTLPDALAPIISALGMNLQDTFGPTKDKINIVSEGMSDYIFNIGSSIAM